MATTDPYHEEVNWAGIDAGSVSLNCVVMDQQKEIVSELPGRRHLGKVDEAVDGLSLRLPFWNYLSNYPVIRLFFLSLLAAAIGYVHFTIRRWAGLRVARRLAAAPMVTEFAPNYVRAFQKNIRWFRSIFRRYPAGWGKRSAHSLAQVSDDSQLYVQQLNDMYANPSGEIQARHEEQDTAPAKSTCS